MCYFKNISFFSHVKDENGVVYIFFSLALLPFILLMLFAIELAITDLYRGRITYALNAAAIAGARYDNNDVPTNVMNIFEANLIDTLPHLPEGVVLDVITTPDTLDITAHYDRNHSLSLFTGGPFTLTENVIVERIAGGLEVAVVLDFSSGTNVSSDLKAFFAYIYSNKTTNNIFGGVAPCCNEFDALPLNDDVSHIDSFLEAVPNQVLLNFRGIKIAHENILDAATALGSITPKNHNVEKNVKFILMVTTNSTVDANFVADCTAAKAAGIKIGIISAGSTTLPEHAACVSKPEWNQHVNSINDIPTALDFLKKEILPIYVTATNTI